MAAYLAYAVPAGIVPAMASLFFSYNRNMMMCFPVFIVLAGLLEPGEQARRNAVKRVVFWALVAVAGTVQIWLLLRHINFVWAG